ncbi:MAG TPA: type II and III secretion system protein family protein [Rhodanobacteraceae bacterium]|nr:type II and III secretion system protein family protein [Rhodanobacteraceae bacterium]
MNRDSFKGLVLLAATLLPFQMLEAQVTQDATLQVGQNLDLVVPLYKSRVLTASSAIARVSVGNPDIADILILRERELYVLGKDLGTTNVLLWNSMDQLVGSVAVEVTHDLEGLKRKLFELFPSERIEVYAAQRSIVLTGSVSSVVNMEAALQLARGYLAQIGTAVQEQQFEQQQASSTDRTGGGVINLMQIAGAQQVMLEVKVAEIARTELRKFEMNFNGINVGGSRWNVGAVNGGATFPDVLFAPDNVRIPVFDESAPWGPVIDEFMPNPLSISDTGFFASLLTTNGLLNLTLDAAKENGLVKILAEPTLTTLSGQEARFLSGGEFPIPVPQGLNGITVEFKEFGVGLIFIPVVLGNGQVNLKLAITVSELNAGNNVVLNAPGTTASFLVPSLSKRSASAAVELLDGQTIGIAGLINEDLREVVTKFPGLGDLPILGNLFRSSQFQKGESELVILVTPHLAQPLPKDRIRLPTDDFIEPNATEFYLFGRIEGKPPEVVPPSGTEPSARNGGVEGGFGQSIE